MNNDWTDILRDKLAEHEMTPPAGLWEEIEAGLNPKPRKKAAWIYSAAACAMILLGLSLFFKLEKSQLPTEQEISNLTAEVEAKQPKPEQELFAEETGKEVAEEEAAEVLKQQKRVVQKKKQPQKTIPQNPQPQTPILEKNTDTEPAVSSSPATSSPKAEGKELAEDNSLLAQDDSFAQSHRKESKASRGIAFGLYAANLPISFGGGEEERWADVLDAPNINDGINNEPQEEIINAKHHRPIRVGISLAYPLSDRLNLSSGVTFSQLDSEIEYIRSQHLTYIGVPLGVSYKVLEYKALSLYLSGGGMVEQCIVGDGFYSTKKGRGRDERLQFSVFGGGGLQVALGKYFSLFAEPRVSYYPDNHSPIINIYKDRPTDFDLNFGLRINFNRF